MSGRTRWRVVGLAGDDRPLVSVMGDLIIDSDNPAAVTFIEQAAAEYGLLLERIEDDDVPPDGPWVGQVDR